jgi:hypothetical protein
MDWSRLSPASITASVGGLALGAYATINLMFPAAFAVVGWLALRNMAPSAKQPAVPSLAWQFGQLGWFILGAALAPTVLKQIWLDIAILAGLMIWFYLSVGRIAAWVLIAYQAASSLVNAWAFLHAPLDSSTDKALAVHIVWRVTAIVLLTLFLRRKVLPDLNTTARTFE